MRSGGVFGSIFRSNPFHPSAEDANRYPPASSSKPFSGFSILAPVGQHMLPQCYPSHKAAHRRFQHGCRNEVLRAMLADLANALRAEGALDEPECRIDATFSSVKGGGAEISPKKRGKGVKTMAIVERHGLPLAVRTQAANHHEITLVQLGFDCCTIEARPENLTGDRACDRDKLDEALRRDGIERIAPHRQNRGRPGTSAP